MAGSVTRDRFLREFISALIYREIFRGNDTIRGVVERGVPVQRDSKKFPEKSSRVFLSGIFVQDFFRENFQKRSCRSGFPGDIFPEIFSSSIFYTPVSPDKVSRTMVLFQVLTHYFSGTSHTSGNNPAP